MCGNTNCNQTNIHRHTLLAVYNQQISPVHIITGLLCLSTQKKHYQYMKTLNWGTPEQFHLQRIKLHYRCVENQCRCTYCMYHYIPMHMFVLYVPLHSNADVCIVCTTAFQCRRMYCMYHYIPIIHITIYTTTVVLDMCQTCAPMLLHVLQCQTYAPMLLYVQQCQTSVRHVSDMCSSVTCSKTCIN